ncbi:MAG: hypothetical protein K8S56_00955, partial [Candidatus Cloacimonetes bacterium]|nr:hypothetical protein [Candidatus Cloacimonadota bacterium]
MNQDYFKINLNKFGAERQKIEMEIKTFRNTVITFVMFFIVFYGFVFYLRSVLDTKLTNRKEYLRVTREKIEAKQTTGEYLSAKDLERIAKASTDRIFWAKKLVALAERED